jgi:hypothetical protein
MAMELKTKNQQLAPQANCSPYLARQMSKWFYDAFTGVATGAARCGSFVENAFSLLVVSSR